jgi:DNA polymerase-3 subunit delta'
MPFRDVIGHRRLVALLARSVERASVPPSLIFAGPAGVGKRLVAVSIAQAVNCLNPRLARPQAPDTIEYDACGTCAACTRIARGIFPDVLLLEPGDSGSIKIDAVRDLVDKVGYRPFEGRRRVVIIDEADALVPQAQNALLKTLEEPPSASMFILVSARPDALLPTVLSRCPRLRFRLLGPDEVAAALMRQGKSEAQARAIAATADGSIGRALEASADEASADELVKARDLVVRVLSQLASTDDPRRRVEGAKELLPKTDGSAAAARQHLATHLRVMASLLRDVELVGVSTDRRALANADIEPALGRLTAFQGERGVRAFAAVDQALVALERNAGVKIVADWVALQV